MKHVYKDFQELYATIRGRIVEIKPTERKFPKKEEAKEEVKEEVKEEKTKKTPKKKKEE